MVWNKNVAGVPFVTCSSFDISRANDGSGTVIGATHRSLGAAIGSLAIALFWNGIVSVFVLVATASTLQLFDVGVPEWFPAPNLGKTPMGTGMTIFLWIFLTPFIVIGLAMIGAFLSSLAGRTEVQLGNSEGILFAGIGPLGQGLHDGDEELFLVAVVVVDGLPGHAGLGRDHVDVGAGITLAAEHMGGSFEDLNAFRRMGSRRANVRSGDGQRHESVYRR